MSKNIHPDRLSKDFFNFLNRDVLLGSLNHQDIGFDVCFDCTLWNEGFKICSDECDSMTTIINPISSTFVSLLNEFECLLYSQLDDCCNHNFAYKSQIERLLRLISDLKNKVSSIQCVDPCSNAGILAFLLSVLIQTILAIISSLEYINTLMAYHDNCGCTSVQIKDIIMGKFINSITEFHCLLHDWYGIVVTFFYHSSTASKPYIAAYVPKQPMPVPQPNPNMSFACVPNPCPPPPPPVSHSNVCGCGPGHSTTFNCK